MGFDELLQAIGEEAGRQRQAILAGADEEARAIVARAGAAQPAELDAARAAADRRARAEAARILSRARLAARREVLAARAEVIAAALHALEERIAALPGTAGYRALLGRLVDECLEEAAGPVTVRCRREDRAAVEEHARRAGMRPRSRRPPSPSAASRSSSAPRGAASCATRSPTASSAAGRCCSRRPAGCSSPGRGTRGRDRRLRLPQRAGARAPGAALSRRDLEPGLAAASLDEFTVFLGGTAYAAAVAEALAVTKGIAGVEEGLRRDFQRTIDHVVRIAAAGRGG